MIAEVVTAERSSLRRPTWSVIIDPGYQYADSRIGRTSDSAHHGRARVDQIELPLGIPISDTRKLKQGRQEIFGSVSARCWTHM
jgi:hypothetical protein